MSVTFTIEAIPTDTWVAECYDPRTDTETEVARADSHEAILVQVEAHKALCGGCRESGLFPRRLFDVEGSEVNVSNDNAGMLLAALGIDFDPGDIHGQMPGEQFLGCVLLALAADRDDSGVCSVMEQEPGRAAVTYWGLRPGWWGDRLGQLHELAREAARLARDVVWG